MPDLKDRLIIVSMKGSSLGLLDGRRLPTQPIDMRKEYANEIVSGVSQSQR